ncbi:MAG: hypothetical protein CMF80_07075 [Candidatus Marinimicrobia bacterium]|nr:hypothetical protein [Candidatus Neomarinimicrobiota bacterium]|tara:strand:- start:1183 stop:1416 length:234 start_codon:yes stop_codon:yes gene_type:complete
MNVLSYINWYAFVFSFIIGIIFMYFYSEEPVKIYVYPTAKNFKNVQVLDKSGTCFSIETKETACPENDSNIKKVPIQ